MLSYTHTLFRVTTSFCNNHCLSLSLPNILSFLKAQPKFRILHEPFLELSSGDFLSFPFHFPHSFICDSLMTHKFLLHHLCQCLTFLIRLSTSWVNGLPPLYICIVDLLKRRTVTSIGKYLKNIVISEWMCQWRNDGMQKWNEWVTSDYLGGSLYNVKDFLLLSLFPVLNPTNSHTPGE